MFFCFFSLQTDSYKYYGTDLDSKDHLDYATSQKTSEVIVAAAQVAGQMALRLVHDHVLNLDTTRYSLVVRNAVVRVYKRILQLSQVCECVSVTRRSIGRHVNICILSSAVRSVEGSGS